MHRVVLFSCFLHMCAFAVCCVTSEAKSARPNIIFFLVDDLGWSDLGCYGSQFHETPNIDGLANTGMRFVNGYAACPVCSPTRASILTGRHPVRVGITDWIPGMRMKPNADVRFQHVTDRDELSLDEVTIAEHLREEANYQTYFLGKWHLGGEGYWPTAQGFDLNIGGFEKGSPPGGYYSPWNNPNLNAKHEGEYLTSRLTDEAVSLIKNANLERPFLLYFSYYNVHTPIQADKRSIKHFRDIAAEKFPDPTPTSKERGAQSRLRQDNPDYASMVRAVDLSVGRILAEVRESGLEDNTVVVFFSDNGGLCTLAENRNHRIGPTCNLPLRSGKGWLYEGGIREPMIIRAPGVTEPASTCETLAVSTDFFPTLLELVGLPLQPELHTDGISLVPAMRGQTTPERSLFWHYPHYHGSGWQPGAAVREGSWKLIEFYETGKTELYNVADDVGEKIERSSDYPEIRDRMKLKLKNWQQQMDAKMPVARVPAK